MYLSYDEYQIAMGGILTADVFSRLAFRAQKAVDAATFGRVAGESPVREAVKRLVFELTELYAANGADGSAVLSSASNDGVSESYVVLSGEELIQREKALISQYLSGEITQEGIPLLYAGVD